MCGFTGFISASFSGDRAAIVASMASAIAHRGPDDSGYWADAISGVALAHQRLSILDTSPAGQQPMTSVCGRYVMVFNGEIYNHQELRRALQESHNIHDWRGHSDTETLLACINVWGFEKTLCATHGMFGIALWDKEENALYLARDRMGEKPLYYGWQGDTFLFGSELKALKAHPDFKCEIDRGALALYFRHNYVPAPYSIYKGILKLPAGSYIKVQATCFSNKGDLKPIPYWSLAAVAEQGSRNHFEGSEADALKELDVRLGSSVKAQMLSDVPLGGLLSGGIDSTMVCALMQSSSSRPVNTFTIGFNEKYYDEASHASAIAKHLGTSHTELYVTAQDALGLVPQMPTMYDEPFADSSQLPTHLVMKMARESVTVALSGDGADELFGGYNRYMYAPKVWRYAEKLPQSLRKAFCASLMAIPASSLNSLSSLFGLSQAGDKAHKLGQRLQGVNCLDDFYVALISEWSNEGGLVLDAQLPSNLIDIREEWPQVSNTVDRMMVLDGLHYLPDDILVKVDRAAMAVSLETRAPFLDHKLVEFAWQLPQKYKIHHGQGKYLLRLLLNRYVPQELTERPKMGFSIPLDDWLRGPLRDWAEDLLAEDRLKREGYLNPSPIRTAWRQHQAGKANYGYRLWSVLMFQAWLAEQQGSL